MARDQMVRHSGGLEMVRTFLVTESTHSRQRVREYGQEGSQLSVGLTGLLGQRRRRGSRWVPQEALLPLVLSTVY